MADPFVAEIRIFGFNFPPTGWAHCNGQLLPISQNSALFSLLGTNFGGNGVNNFALPNIQGAFPMHWNQGPGLSPRYIGERGGEASVTLLHSELPLHTHGLRGSDGLAPQQAPAAIGPSPARPFAAGSANASLNVQAAQVTGSSQPHENMHPFLTLNFCIALQGIFPSRP